MSTAHIEWRRIEVVITGRTRNAFALRGTRVRIPPSPLSKNPVTMQVSGFFSYIFYLVYTIPVQPLEVSVILHELVKRNRHKTVNIRLCHP